MMAKASGTVAVLGMLAWTSAAVFGCTAKSNTSAARSAQGTTSPGGREEQELRPVSLPDLSQMAESAQRQVRDRHAVLLQKMKNRVSAPVELADAYGELGKILMAADHRDAAEPCLLDAQTLAPDDARWPYYLGHLNRQNGDLEKARPFFERALQLKPDDIATLVWLGNLHLDRGRPDEAEQKFAKALSLQANSVSARFGLGRAALAKQEFGRAVENLEAVLTKDPEAAGAHYPLAMAYRGLGETRKAEAHLALRKDSQILPADPLIVELDELLESPQTYEARGIQALDRNDWAGAAELFRRGLRLAPDHAALGHRLGTALYMMGDVRGAQEQFEKVVHASPDYFLAQYSFGVLLQANGRHAEAIDHFSSALRSRPGYTEARLALANSLRRAGRVRESLAHYEQVLMQSPDSTDARFGYAMAFVQLHRYQEAGKRLDEGMKAYPDQPTFAHALARLLSAAPDDKVRDGARAIALVQELLRKEQRSLALGETMAMALAELGRFDEAAAVQRDLVKGAEKGGLNVIARRLTRNLALYERRMPCRTPWTDDEMP